MKARKLIETIQMNEGETGFRNIKFIKLVRASDSRNLDDPKNHAWIEIETDNFRREFKMSIGSEGIDQMISELKDLKKKLPK